MTCKYCQKECTYNNKKHTICTECGQIFCGDIRKRLCPGCDRTLTLELTREQAEEVLEALEYHGFDHENVIRQIEEQLKRSV